MLIGFLLFALDRFPLFQDRAGVARIALAKNRVDGAGRVCR